MLDTILASASTDAVTTAAFTLPQFLACTLVSLFLGFCVAAVYMYRNTYSKSFVVTLALLPVMVQIVIMLVNGNLGTGVAVMGAFGLIRFRSVPGTAREISSIFFAMAIGLATGMGYLAYAALFLVIVGAVMLLVSSSRFGEAGRGVRILKITIPENLDYEGVFDDILAQHTLRADLEQVRTVNMGSLFELHYRICLRSPVIPKEFLDALRCRNGNLNIVCGRVASGKEEL